MNIKKILFIFNKARNKNRNKKINNNKKEK